MKMNRNQRVCLCPGNCERAGERVAYIFLKLGGQERHIECLQTCQKREISIVFRCTGIIQRGSFCVSREEGSGWGMCSLCYVRLCGWEVQIGCMKTCERGGIEVMKDRDEQGLEGLCVCLEKSEGPGKCEAFIMLDQEDKKDKLSACRIVRGEGIQVLIEGQ